MKVLVLLLGIVVAHGGTAVQQSSYEPRIDGLRPEVPGVSARLVDAGTRVEIDAGEHELVVLGYQDEPFLLIDEGGVYENVLSPSTYLNRSLDGDAIPPDANPNADPQWERVGAGPVARFHDHALHVPPGQQLGLRDESTWHIPMRVDGRDVFLDGRLVTLADVSLLPWLVLAGAIAVFAIASVRVTGARTSVMLLVVLLVADAMRLYGNVFGTPGWLASRAEVLGDEWAWPIVGWGLVLAALALHRMRRPFEAAAASIVGAAVVGFSGGALEVPDIRSPRLMTELPDMVTRGVIAAVLGLGLGIALRSVLELTRSSSTPARHGPRSGSAPTRAGGTRRASRSRPASG